MKHTTTDPLDITRLEYEYLKDRLTRLATSGDYAHLRDQECVDAVSSCVAGFTKLGSNRLYQETRALVDRLQTVVDHGYDVSHGTLNHEIFALLVEHVPEEYRPEERGPSDAYLDALAGSGPSLG